jgi:hypothetical protein
MATLVQEHTKASPNNSTQLMFDLAAAPVVGHLLVVIGSAPKGSVTSIHGCGTNLTRAAASRNDANVEIWYAICAGTMKTVTLTGSSGYLWMWASEWAGLITSASSVLDVTSANGQVSLMPASGPITTTSNDLLIFAVADYSTTYGTPMTTSAGPWTSLTGVTEPMTVAVQAEWYQIAAPGMYAPTVMELSGGTASGWDAAVAAFRLR